MAHVEDPRIADLIAIVEEFSSQLAVRLTELAVSQEASVRVAMQSEVRQILRSMRQAIQSWLTSVFGEMVRDIDEDLLADIPAQLLEVDDISLGPVTEVSSVVQRFQQDTETAISAIDVMASRLSNGDSSPVVAEDKHRLLVALSAGAAGAASVASIRARAINRMRSQLLQLLGANGRIYRYDLGYYVALAAHVFKGNLSHQISLTRASRLGSDLVQVSPQRSTIGDYCDLYRGKVFSISGTHRFANPLSLAPAGGTPFHPWCHHWMIPFDESSVSPEKLRELTKIPKDFLDLARNNGSPNDFQRLWRKHNGVSRNRKRSKRGK